MSNLEEHPDETTCGGAVRVAAEPAVHLLPGREVPLGRYATVRRMLPDRDRRTVGAWCFLDHFGSPEIRQSGSPDIRQSGSPEIRQSGSAEALPDGPGMRVPPHPHTGLQTVSWLLAGEITHRDTLDNLQTIQPGQLNLMTAGLGIAHSEVSAASRPLHGLQLWVALPESARHAPPRFEHHASLPVLEDAGLTITVVAGALDGVASPALVHTPLVGADIALTAGAGTELPVEPDFEYAAVVVEGAVDVAGVRLTPGALLYLGRGRSRLPLAGDGPGRVFLIGGEPFEEELIMWWNFVARTHEEIVECRADWMAERRFGTVYGYDGDRLPAPPLPNARLRARRRDGS